MILERNPLAALWGFSCNESFVFLLLPLDIPFTSDIFMTLCRGVCLCGIPSFVGVQAGSLGGSQVLCSQSHQCRCSEISSCAPGPAMEAGSSSGPARPPCTPTKPTAARARPVPAREPHCPLVCPAGTKWTELEAVVEIGSWHSHGEDDFSFATVGEGPAGARELQVLWSGAVLGE